MNDKELSELIMKKIKDWQTSQENQTDGYEYERSLHAVVQSLGNDIMQASIGELPENRKLKKNVDNIRASRGEA